MEGIHILSLRRLLHLYMPIYNNLKNIYYTLVGILYSKSKTLMITTYISRVVSMTMQYFNIMFFKRI